MIDNKIDWNEAPEGATHYHTNLENWYMLKNGAWFFWGLSSGSKGWVPSATSFLDFDLMVSKGMIVWSGDDFPPSGTKVWFTPYLEDKAVFIVVGPYKDKVVIVRDDKHQEVYMAKAEALTPYDAEAERQKAISEIIEAAEQRIDEHAAGLLYDAGYQKQGGNK